MSGLNKVQLIGRLGADPELKFTQSGTPVLNMRLAVNERWKDKDGQQKERVEWCGCVMWGPRAQGVAPHLGKGSRLYVEGRLQTRKWQDKEGNDRYTTEIVVSEIIFLDSKGDGEPRSGARYRDGGGSQSTGRGQALPDDDYGGGFGDDDIPFAPADERLS